MSTATATIEKKSSKKNKSVRIIARYALNNGTIAYRVENGESKQYCCTLNANGKWGCMGQNNEECPSAKYNKSHICYHIEHCQQHEDEYYIAGILIDTPAMEEEAVEEVVEQAPATQAEQEAEAIVEAAFEQAIAEEEPVDPWKGFSDEEKYVAWRNYEIVMSASGW